LGSVDPLEPIVPAPMAYSNYHHTESYAYGTQLHYMPMNKPLVVV